jgi:Flp pilus assembly protein TadB
MSATRPSRPRTEERSAAPVPRDIGLLRARRREANRRRRLLRVDLGIGVAVALILLLATPGLAIAAILAGVLLLACVASVVHQRRRARGRVAPSEPRRAAGDSSRPHSARNGGAEEHSG